MKKELCLKLVIYKDYTEMHGQQNTKLYKKINFTPIFFPDGSSRNGTLS